MLALLDAAENTQNNLSSAQCQYPQRHPTDSAVTARFGWGIHWESTLCGRKCPVLFFHTKPYHTESYTVYYDCLQLVGVIANYILHFN